MIAVEHLIFTAVYMAFLEVVTLPILAILLLPLCLIGVFVGAEPVLVGACSVIAIGWQVALVWLARNAARRKFVGQTGFIQGLRQAFPEGRLYLAFVPVVGKYLVPKS